MNVGPSVFGTDIIIAQMLTEDNINDIHPELHNVKQVSGSDTHALILTTEGKVYSFGGNKYGQLGLGNRRKRTAPVLIESLSDIVSVSTGHSYSLALKSDGTVFFFGTNHSLYNDVRIFPSRSDTVDFPTLIPGIDNAVLIESIKYGYIIITSDNRIISSNLFRRGTLDDLIALGPNAGLKLNFNVISASGTVTYTTINHGYLLLSSDGTVYTLDEDGGNLDVINGINDAVMVSNGENSLILSSKGHVYVYGNLYGERVVAGPGTFRRFVDQHEIIPFINDAIYVKANTTYSGFSYIVTDDGVGDNILYYKSLPILKDNGRLPARISKNIIAVSGGSYNVFMVC